MTTEKFKFIFAYNPEKPLYKALKKRLIKVAEKYSLEVQEDKDETMIRFSLVGDLEPPKLGFAGLLSELSLDDTRRININRDLKAIEKTIFRYKRILDI